MTGAVLPWPSFFDGTNKTLSQTKRKMVSRRSPTSLFSSSSKTSDGAENGLSPFNFARFTARSLSLFLIFEAMSGVRDLLKNLPARCVCRSAVAAYAESTAKTSLGENGVAIDV